MSAKNRASQPPVHARFSAYLISHARALFFSLGKLYRAPLASLMTMAVIGVALALPTGLFLALKNLQAVSGGWEQGTRISLFLKLDTSAEKGRELSKRIKSRPEVATVQWIDRDEALEEFRALSGFGTALEALENNPLPAVIVVQPLPAPPSKVEHLVSELRTLPEIERAQLDAQWLQRLYALMELARRGVWVIAGMLGLAVLLIVGNTIRLDIQNRREEIEVTKLIGATDGFIRRPFLYGGIWYGLLGGLLGIIMVQAALGFLDAPTQQLAGLYASDFALLSLDASTTMAILGLSTLLGLGGSWLAVGRHLRQIEPR